MPLIERFIPANKTLDIVMSRLERIVNTMVSGIWLKRKGENFTITNTSGGQVIEYQGTPPVQANLAGMPSYVFNFIELINQIIEEQGASTSALGNLPQGVKSGVAIESIKATEYANLKIPSDMIKNSIKRIGEKMVELGADFVIPQTVALMESGELNKFDIVGERGQLKRNELDMELPEDITTIRKGQKIDIEVEQGMGFTYEGKKQTMQQIIKFITEMAELGYMTRDSARVIIDRTLETFQFGATQEFMDGFDEGTQPITDAEVDKIKIAVAEVMRDLGIGGQDEEQRMVDTTKLGVAEAMQDLQGGNQ